MSDDDPQDSSRIPATGGWLRRWTSSKRLFESRLAPLLIAGWVALGVLVFQRMRPESEAARAGDAERAGPVGRDSADLDPLEVLYRGCAHVLGPLDEPTCVLAPEASLRLWVPALGQAEIQTDGAPWRPAAGEKLEGGSLISPALPPRPRRLAVRVAGDPRPPWRLRLRLLTQASRDERSRLIKIAQDLLKEGGAQPKAAAAEALRGELMSVRDPAVRSSIGSTIARLRWDLGQGDLSAASESFRLAIAEHRGWRDFKSEIDDATLLFRLLFYDLEDVDGARRILESLPESAAGHMESEYLLAYTRGSLARRTGDVRGALGGLRRAADLARRFGDLQWRINAEQLLALQLTALGQHGKAESLFQALLGESESLRACRKGQLLNAAAWQGLLAREAGRATPDPLPLLLRASAALDECPASDSSSEERLNVELNMALGHLQNGSVEEAGRHLQAATEITEQPPLRLLLWWRELQARVVMSRGQLQEAARLYRDLAELSRRLSAPGAAWRADVGEARALSEAGRIEEALAAFAAGEARLDAAARRVPVQVSRARWQAVRQAGLHDYLDLLLEQRLDALAFRVARQARARANQGLATRARIAELTPEERRRWNVAVLEYQKELRALDGALATSWQLPADRVAEADLRRERSGEQRALLFDDAFSVLERGRPAQAELPPLREGELVLLYHPLGDGWVGFAADASGVRARRLGRIDLAADGAALAAGLLEPFRDALESPARLRILAHGALEEVDFHALPWGSSVLLADREVIYGLDMPALESSGRSRSGVATALVVADPTVTLVGASEFEVPRIGSLLGESPSWRVETLEGPTASRLRSRLDGPDLFHFAGHAVLRGRTESYLQLAERSRLALGEVLTLPRVPPEVVLSACRGAGPESGEEGSGLSLAQAFLLAGSETVVAAVRPVDDVATGRLMIGLYEQRLRHPTLAQALRSAQLEARGQEPEGVWSSFRVLER